MVKTKDGIGLVIGIETPFNNFFVMANLAKVTVWYGSEKSFNDNIKFTHQVYKISDVKPL